MSKLDEDIDLLMGQCYADPLRYVMAVFPWRTEKAIQIVKLQEPWKSRFPACEFGPDVWACEFLDQLGEEIKKRGFKPGMPPVDPIRFSTASGHGIGKSVMVAWLIKFILDTRPHARGVVTAMTGEQLKTKTWAEVGKWNALSLTAHLWEYSASRGAMSLYRKNSKLPWRCDALTCREENSEAFQGLHAADSTPFYIFDEASGIPPAIWNARLGGLTDGEPMVFDFGNPTRNSGEFYENTVGKMKHRYITRAIDSRTVAITNKKYFAEMAQDFGEESDRFKVRCRGLFPSAGSAQFIPSDAVTMAGLRPIPNNYHSDRSVPLIIGVDVARFGGDESVIYPRLGYDARSFEPERFNNTDTVYTSGRVIEMIRKFQALGRQPDAVFIDETGIGGAVVDQLRNLGYHVIGVQAAGTCIDKGTYRFKSDEMWGRLRDALPRLCLPPRTERVGQEIYDQLTQREYGFTKLGAKVHLESKEDMAARGLSSPDIADALALTFAFDVVARGAAESFAYSAPRFSTYEYDPLEIKD
jgi:hypothetical protein